MTSIAIATCRDLPNLNDDDRAVMDRLHQIGVEAVPCIWDDPSVNWVAYDAVLIRSVWDYTGRRADLLAWLDGLDAAGVLAWNPTDMIRWNSHKGYLRDLEGRGIKVVSTEWLTASDDPYQAMQVHGWLEAVLKPAVSASAINTHRLSLADPHPVQMSMAEDWLLQPYQPEVAQNGELSLIYFNGTYSHALLKRPAPGDFRVQEEHGGANTTVYPSVETIASGRAVLDVLDVMPLYARVDVLALPVGLLLMELEIFEPNLYLSYGDGAVEAFARAILERVGG